VHPDRLAGRKRPEDYYDVDGDDEDGKEETRAKKAEGDEPEDDKEGSNAGTGGEMVAAKTDTHQSPPRQKQRGDNGEALHMPKGPQSARMLAHKGGMVAGTRNGPSQRDQSQRGEGYDATGDTSAATAMEGQPMTAQGTENDRGAEDRKTTKRKKEGDENLIDTAGGGSGRTRPEDYHDDDGDERDGNKETGAKKVEGDGPRDDKEEGTMGMAGDMQGG
jgi:hypothetical protein